MARSSKPPVDSRNTAIAKACGGLAGMAESLTIAADKLRDVRERCKVLWESELLSGVDQLRLNAISDAASSCLIKLQDHHPIPKQIEAALTMRERGGEPELE